MTRAASSSSNLQPGDRHYRAFVGPPEGYDTMAALQFNLLTTLGLREHHRLLDIGCGSLRGGRLFIPYLLPGGYCGLEPEEWLVREGIEHEIGNDLLRIKQPVLKHHADFNLSVFGGKFDFILAQSIFSHASARQIIACLHQVRDALEPWGIMAATFVVGDEDYTGEVWAYPHCVRYTEARMKQMANGAGLGLRLIDWPHPSQVWVLLCPEGREQFLLEPRNALIKLDRSTLAVAQYAEDCAGWGYLDDVQVDGTRIFVRGWTRNPETHLPVKDVLIIDQDKRIVDCTVAWAPRRDVAEFFKSPSLEHCGFIHVFPKSELQSGPNRLSAYAYLPNSRRAVRLQCNPAVDGIVIHRD